MSPLSTSLPILLTIAAGVCVVIQQVLNANLSTALKSAAWSGVLSYLLGLICMVLLALILREPLPPAAVAARIPWWVWSGGLFGAIFIALAMLLVPQLGAATFLALLIAGQMLASITLDHYGWLGLAERPVDPMRLLGVALLVAGVILIRR